MYQPVKIDYKRDPSFLRGLLIPWIICLLAALFYLYDFVLRVTPSVMIHPLMSDYNVNAMQIGLLSAFYYYVYTPLQLPSGPIVDKYSRRWVLTISILVCALGAALFAYTDNLIVAFIARMMMGFGSAFAFVGALKLASMWLPSNQFALFSGITTAFGTIGAIATDTVLSHLVNSYGWRDTIYLTAIIGFVLTAIIFLVIRDQPKWLPEMPSDYGSWKNVLGRIFETIRNWRIWVNGFVGCFLFLPITVFASLWGVDFLAQAYQIPTTKAALLTSLLFWGSAIGMPIIGWVSDLMKSRRIPLFVGGLLTLVLTTVAIYINSLPIWLMGILLFLIGFVLSPQVLVFAIAREISPPRTSGTSTAVTNFIVTIGAAVFQPLVGYMLDQSWTGKETPLGTPLFSMHSYHYAFISLVIVLVLSFFLTFLVPKTECQRIHPAFKVPKFKRRRKKQNN